MNYAELIGIVFDTQYTPFTSFDCNDYNFKIHYLTDLLETEVYLVTCLKVHKLL